MAYICLITQAKSRHIFLSHGMRDAFVARYGELASDIVDNSVYTPKYRYKTIKGSGIILGFLSNLCKEKGIYDTFSLFEGLVEIGVDVRLCIAGPPQDDTVAADLQMFLDRWGDRVVYRGALAGEMKAMFFTEFDVFVFPTNFTQEAQPNVIYEALAAGCAVISKRRGCIDEMIEGFEDCYAFEENEFHQSALTTIHSFAKEADRLRYSRENRIKKYFTRRNLNMKHLREVTSKIADQDIKIDDDFPNYLYPDERCSDDTKTHARKN